MIQSNPSPGVVGGIPALRTRPVSLEQYVFSPRWFLLLTLGVFAWGGE